MSSYLNIDSKVDREFAPYIATKKVESMEPKIELEEEVKEGYTASEFSSLVSDMKTGDNTKFYDMGNTLKYNPSDPEYIPTLREAAIEDKNQLIVQQNTMFALGTMSAVSVAVVLFMLSNRA